MYVDATNLYGYALSQSLPYDEIKFEKKGILEDITNTPDDSDIGYFLEIDSKYPDNLKKLRISQLFLKRLMLMFLHHI